MKILRQQNVTLADLLCESDWNDLCAAGTRTSFSNGQLIEEKGDTRDGISLVLSGEIAVGNIRQDGSFLVSGLLREGECFGQFTAFLNLPQTHSLWAVDQTEVIFIGQRELAQTLETNPAIYAGLLKLALWRNVELLDFLDAQRRLPLPIRIARLLLIAPAEEPDQSVIDCRQEDLADTLGVSRVAVGKALKKLEAQEMIEIGYRKIILLSRPGLSRLVELHQSQT